MFMQKARQKLLLKCSKASQEHAIRSRELFTEYLEKTEMVFTDTGRKWITLNMH